MNELFPYLGVVSSIWLVVGVIWAGSLYSGYSHSRQFCSELGATGAPTQKISPLINNYPLGILFVLFGWYVLSLKNDQTHLVVVGGAVILHGIGTWLAGVFPMDKDPYTKNPSVSGKIHALSGLIMFVSLAVAPIAVASSSSYALTFRIFSILCVIAAVIPLLVMGKSENAREKPGLYQRISYGVQLVWLSCFSLLLAW